MDDVEVHYFPEETPHLNVYPRVSCPVPRFRAQMQCWSSHHRTVSRPFPRLGRDVLGFLWDTIPWIFISQEKSIQNGLNRTAFLQKQWICMGFWMEFHGILNGILVGYLCLKTADAPKLPFESVVFPFHWTWFFHVFFPNFFFPSRLASQVLQFWSHYRESHTLRASAQADWKHGNLRSTKKRWDLPFSGVYYIPDFLRNLTIISDYFRCLLTDFIFFASKYGLFSFIFDVKRATGDPPAPVPVLSSRGHAPTDVGLDASGSHIAGGGALRLWGGVKTLHIWFSLSLYILMYVYIYICKRTYVYIYMITLYIYA